ncbi:MAG: hypothetical protein IJC15_06660 [Clostridia bacterium]|nr:hypothetical protein [Clostridia bacterium]
MPTLKELSRESGLSQSTLSRALNYCPGTGEEAARIASRLKEKYDMNPIPPDRYTIGVILPEGPKFYWSTAWQHLRIALQETGVSYRPAFIESLRNSCTEIALSILQEMEEAGIRAIIMPYFPACADYIRQSKMRYFFVSEPSTLVNTFSFCSDGYRDGFQLGQLMRQHLPDRQRVVIVLSDNETANVRQRGFEDAVGHDRIYGIVTVPAGRLPLLPSILAREITAHGLTDMDTLCCLSGVTHKAALAIHKLGRLNDVVVIGFERPSADNQYMQDGTIALLMVQNIVGQSRAAALAASEYVCTGLMPKQKYTLIQSNPVINR